MSIQKLELSIEFIDKYKNYFFIFIIFLASLELLKTAWISDDAAITLRSVLNFIHGFGPNYNIDERVQSFTHPLWFLLIFVGVLLINNIFAVTFILSIGISLFVIVILINKIAYNFYQGICAAFILLLSKAYVDFSTSGLENPLAHLLLLGLLLIAQEAYKHINIKNSRNFFLFTSLIYLTRPDLILLSLPFGIYLLVKNKFSFKFLLQAVVIGFSPIILWTFFSLYYYGFPFPNTAYAKLNTGFSHLYYLKNGFNYFLDSLVRDPITLSLILLVSIFRNSLFARLFIYGIACYFSYLLFIGGDFMSGRLLTPTYLLAVALFCSTKFSISDWESTLIVLFLGLLKMNTTLLSGLAYSNQNIDSGIADERGYYFQKYGLLTADKGTFSTPK